MANHLSDIGFQVKTDQDTNIYIQKAINHGKKLKVEKGYYIQWAPGKGIELWIQFNKKNQLIGFNPHFTGKSKIQAELTANINRPQMSELDGAYYAWADPEINQPNKGKYPFAFDIPNFLLYGSLPFPSIVTSQIAAFAHKLDAYPNEQAFLDAHPSTFKFATESFIPAGLFKPEGTPINPPESIAIFNGTVLESALVINPETEHKFQWALVKTYGGTFDLVADPEIIHGNMVTSGIISGTFWLSGRLTDYPIPAKKSFWQKLFL